MNIRLEDDVSLNVWKSKMMTCRPLREQWNLKKQTESNCKNIPLAGVTGITVAPEWKEAPPDSRLRSMIRPVI